MGNLMEYKGYHAKIEYSDEDNTFFGRVIGVNDVLAFDGENISELRDMFKETIDDYLEMCEELGQLPDKEYKGSFNVRISPELHKQAYLTAVAQGISLNQFVATAIENEVQGHHSQSTTTLVVPPQVIEKYATKICNSTYNEPVFSDRKGVQVCKKFKSKSKVLTY